MLKNVIVKGQIYTILFFFHTLLTFNEFSVDTHHYIYFAFYSKYKYSTVINECVKIYSNSSIYHCEIVFGNPCFTRNNNNNNNIDMNYLLGITNPETQTCNIDSHNTKINFQSNKDYNSTRWIFLKLKVTLEKELAFIRSLNMRIGDNFSLFRMLFGNCVGSNKWFCSELLTTVLLENGFITGYNPLNTTPSDVYEILVKLGAQKIEKN